jgi:hypothetical protein
MGKRKRDRDDPIGEYVEWTENRYNPGYWLGGRVPPHVKQSLTSKDRRWVGAIRLLPFVVAAVLSWRRGWPYDFDESLVMVIIGVPCLVLGLLLLLVPSSKKKSKTRDA